MLKRILVTFFRIRAQLRWSHACASQFGRLKISSGLLPARFDSTHDMLEPVIKNQALLLKKLDQ